MNFNRGVKKQSEDQIRTGLLQLAHNCAAFEEMAILGEGNVSGRLNDQRFLLKAGGTQLRSLTSDQLVEVESREIIDSLDGPNLDAQQIEALLLESRLNRNALKPSVETLFHAWLLTLPGIGFIGHSHPNHVNQLLCSPHAKELAERRLFPDQIIYCGKQPVFVSYSEA